MKDDRIHWDRRYHEGSHHSLEPDPFLVNAYAEFIEPLFPKPGKALDFAGGVGRHAVWLAERGWQVNLLDISEVGVDKAKKNAGALARKIKFEVRDLQQFEAAESYGLVLVFFYLQREMFSELIKSLNPGGLLIYKTYTQLQKTFGGGPSHPMHLLKPNELLRAFQGIEVLYYHETVAQRGVAELIGRKV